MTYVNMRILYCSIILLCVLSVWATCTSAEVYPQEEGGINKDAEKVDTKLDVEEDKKMEYNIEEGKVKDYHNVKTNPESELGVNLGFVHAFVASFSVIIVSELGDKTFFIAAIMAMRHVRLTVFGGAMGALSLMTVLSAFLGFAITIIPKVYTYYASSALFIIFGLRMLREGWFMSPDEGQEELEEVQADLKRRDEEKKYGEGCISSTRWKKEAKLTLSQDVESGIIRGGRIRYRCFGLLSPIFLQAFTLTFLAEWGDRSQIATIVLAAREDVTGVTLGGIIGHSICTAIAVIGGRMVAQSISVRTVTLLGAVVFLLFGFSAFLFSPDT